MADSMSITGGTPKIDYAKWKKLTPQEIIKEQSKGQEIPAEIITWAQQMQKFDQIPDDVTYEEVDGDCVEVCNKGESHYLENSSTDKWLVIFSVKRK